MKSKPEMRPGMLSLVSNSRRVMWEAETPHPGVTIPDPLERRHSDVSSVGQLCMSSGREAVAERMHRRELQEDV